MRKVSFSRKKLFKIVICKMIALDWWFSRSGFCTGTTLCTCYKCRFSSPKWVYWIRNSQSGAHQSFDKLPLEFWCLVRLEKKTLDSGTWVNKANIDESEFLGWFSLNLSLPTWGSFQGPKSSNSESLPSHHQYKKFSGGSDEQVDGETLL